MSTRNGLLSMAGRTIVLATISALILTTSQSSLTAAPAARPSQGISATATSSDATDFSSRRHYRHYRGGNAAGAAMMGLAFGAIAGAIAAQQRRDYYEDYGYYYGPGYYDGPRYYRPYYGHRHFYYYPPY
jgi:guanyl-specific ribonuclease Sa